MARGKKAEKELTPEEKLKRALVPKEEWPYEIPENWCWVRLSDLSEIISKGTTPKGGKDAYVSEGINFLRVENINDDGTISHDTIAHVTSEMHTGFLKRSILKKGDILVSIAGTLGKTGIVDEADLPLNTNQAVSFIRLKSECLNRRYIKASIDNPVTQNLLLAKTKVTSIPNLTLKIIGDCMIPLAPLGEQQRIVDRLESIFAKLDEAKEKVLDVVKSFELRKSAILHKAFTGELTEQWRQEHGIGMDSWKSKLLSECCLISSGGTPSRKKMEYYNGDIPWVKTSEIDWNYIYDTEEKINEEGLENSSAKLYKEGAVLVAMYGMGVTRGRAAILKTSAATNQAVCVLQPGKYLNNRFLFYFFMCHYWDVRDQAVGGNQLNLSGTIIGRFQIMIPTIFEQIEIIRILDAFTIKEKQAKEILQVVIDRIDNMKKAVLVRAFHGKLGTDDLTEEDAVELLKRIL